MTVEIGFSATEKIFEATLDDVATYLGYQGITGTDLQNLSPSVLMNPGLLLSACSNDGGPCVNPLQNRDAVVEHLGALVIRPDDILATRFFAPKIINIKDPEATRKLGWRKLVRLRSRPGSQASVHQIAAGVILFNIFTAPGATPFVPTDESVNTQVMLLTSAARIPPPRTAGPATLYWLDFDPLSKGGKLSLKLDASFDANELPAGSGGVQPYFVPDGCVACHGDNTTRPMVNYLDTDHWFDRLDNDFAALKTSDLPLLVDAQTNDANSLSYGLAFDVLRRFNAEADVHARKAQPRHDEALAAQQWLELHAASNQHFAPVDRAIGSKSRWSAQAPNDVAALDILNQYCFRCHGTVKFSVFNKQSVLDRAPKIRARLSDHAEPGFRMPPDRDLPSSSRAAILKILP